MPIVSSGASQEFNGGVTSNLQIYGRVFVKNPGVVVSSVIADGGVVTAGATSWVPPVTYLSSGGTVSASTISSGGSVLINICGVADGNTIMGGGTMSVSGDSDGGIDRFGSATKNTVSNGGALVISRWGRGYSNTAVSGGSIVINSLGVGHNDTAEPGGILVVTAGGTEIATSGIVANAQVSAGGTIIASTSGIISNAAISNGGSGLISDNGVMSAATVYSGGFININRGLFSGGTINRGGSAFVNKEGIIAQSLISGGTVTAGITNGRNPWYVSSGGTVLSNTVEAGGILTVSNGGTGVNNTVGSGGTLQAIGWSDTIPSNGAPSPGVLSDSIILNGGIAVFNRGVGHNTLVSSGGVLSNGPGGTSYNATAQSGGTILLYQSGVGYNDTAEPGGVLLISAGGTEIATSGTVANAQVSAGGTIIASTSGIISNAAISNGGSGLISDNGIINSYTIHSGGYISVDRGILSGGYVNSGGVAFVKSGGTISQSLISGGTVTAGITNGRNPWYVSSGGAVLSNTVESGGILTVSNGGNASGNIVGNGGTIVAAGWDDVTPVNGIPEAGTANGNYISSGGTLVLRNGAAGSGNVIGNGAVEYISSGSTETGATINSGGTISIPSASSLISGILNPHGTIDFSFLQDNITSANITSTGLLTVYAGASSSSIQLAGTYSVNEFSYSGKSVTLTCFLEGTKILTARGLIAVENLQVGDFIVCWDPELGQNTEKAIKWIGSQRNTITEGEYDDEAGYLVHFAPNSLDDGLPVGDLWVTPEHCMYIDGCFIPSRMLVNGINITYDKSKNNYTVYHVETENHSIIYAEGTRTESYLDTGNRNNFTPHSNLFRLGGNKVLSWDNDAAARLEVSRSMVEPIFNRIVERSGIDIFRQDMISQHNICLVTDDGSVHHPIRVNENKYIFRIDDEFESLNIVSNSSRPCDVIGPFVDDRRNLGILVGKVYVCHNNETVIVNEHLHDASLTGWHPVECDEVRWTTGSAILNLNLSDSSDILIIAIEVKAGGPYLTENYIDNIEKVRPKHLKYNIL